MPTSVPSGITQLTPEVDTPSQATIQLDPPYTEMPAWASSDSDKVYSVEHVLSKYCDITSVPSRVMLQTLAQYASDPEEKSVPSPHDYESY